MYKQELLPAFTTEQQAKAHILLATRVAFMMGRKFEEGDWAGVYCAARNIKKTGWSNLNIDVNHENQGIEHKMLCIRQANILSACGCTYMHPSATRSIRLPPLDSDPNDAMQDILTQYAEFLEQRRLRVLRSCEGYTEADMRTGWLLWQESLREFLYFEERTQIPNPNDYQAQWVINAPRGARKASKNLWIFEKDTGKKRFSVTTTAGAKIQPYFDVPAVGSEHLYHFTVIGEQIAADSIRIWITEPTYQNLFLLLGGDVSKENLSRQILSAANNLKDATFAQTYDYEKAHEIVVSKEAYSAMQAVLPGVNDDNSMQLLVGYLLRR